RGRGLRHVPGPGAAGLPGAHRLHVLEGDADRRPRRDQPGDPPPCPRRSALLAGSDRAGRRLDQRDRCLGGRKPPGPPDELQSLLAPEGRPPGHHHGEDLPRAPGDPRGRLPAAGIRAMDFSLPPRAAEYRERAEKFVREVVLPLEDRTSEGILPDELLESARSRAREVRLWAPGLPEDLGGQGLDLLEAMGVLEAAGQSLLGPLV